MKSIPLVRHHKWLCTLIVGCLGAVANAATLRVNNSDGELGPATVKDNYKLIGLVGDYVDLDPGQHILRIGAPRDYSLVLELAVSQDDAVRVVSARMEPGNCKTQFETSWTAPTITQIASKKTAKKARKVNGNGVETETSVAVVEAPHAPLTLQVNTPTFGAPTGKGSCSMPMMLSCTQHYAPVTVESSPAGAQVWVENEPMGEPTQTTLSVPFCSHNTTKAFLVRLSGRVTCLKEVSLTEGVATTVSCNLRKPK